MWKILVNRSLIVASVLIGASLALASPSNADSMFTKIKYLSSYEFDEVGGNDAGTAYEAKGEMELDAEIQVIIDAGTIGRVEAWNAVSMFRTEDTDWIQLQASAHKHYTVPKPKKDNIVVSVHIPDGTASSDWPNLNEENLPKKLGPLMVAYCNRMAHTLRLQGKSNEEIFSQERTVSVGVGTRGRGWTSLSGELDTSQPDIVDNHNIDHEVDFSSLTKINLICKRSPPPKPPETADVIKFDAGPLKAKAIDLALNVHPTETHQKLTGGPRCPVLYVRTTITANKAGLIATERVRQINGGSPITDNVPISTTFQGDNTFSGIRLQKYYLDDGDHVKIYAKVQSGDSVISTAPGEITIQCEASGSDFTQDTSDYESTATMEILDIDAGKKNDTTCPRNGRVIFAFSSNYSFPIKYRLTSNNGIDKSGTLEMFKSGEEWKGLVITPFPIEETVEMGAVLRQTQNGATKFVATATKTFNCVTPIVNTGSDDVATTPLPDPDAPRSAWSGEVTVADSSGPKVCPREGQAFFEVHTDAPGNFDYRLNCTNGQFFTGSKQSFGSPGNYKAFGAHNINITKNRNIQCSLQEVRPNGVRITVAKGDHDYSCNREIVGTGTNDLVPTQLPDPDSLPRVSQKLTGDFFIVDGDAPKCDRIAKALLVFRTNKPDDIYYNLDCRSISFGRFHPPLTPVPHPQGGYSAVKVIKFDVTKTFSRSCTLKGGTAGPHRILGKKKSHTFICKTPTTNPGPDDKTTRPNPTSAGTPQLVAACKSDEYRVKDTGECVELPGVSIHCEPGYREIEGGCEKIPGVSILCKPGYELKDDSCVKTPVIGIIGTTSSGVKAAEAAKRRKAKADAARAAERRRKAAQATNLRKRAAAATKRRKAKEDAARAAKRRKAASQAATRRKAAKATAARRKAEQRRKARRADARRKAATAAKRRKATQRRKVRKPRRRPARKAVR